LQGENGVVGTRRHASAAETRRLVRRKRRADGVKSAFDLTLCPLPSKGHSPIPHLPPSHISPLRFC
jgi:hypothetical protein